MAQIWITSKTSRFISGFVTLPTQNPPLVTLTSPQNTHCHKRRSVRVVLAAIISISPLTSGRT